jgi:hypothetical protein
LLQFDEKAVWIANHYLAKLAVRISGGIYGGCPDGDDGSTRGFHLRQNFFDISHLQNQGRRSNVLDILTNCLAWSAREFRQLKPKGCVRNAERRRSKAHALSGCELRHVFVELLWLLCKRIAGSIHRQPQNVAIERHRLIETFCGMREVLQLNYRNRDRIRLSKGERANEARDDRNLQ